MNDTILEILENIDLIDVKDLKILNEFPKMDVHKKSKYSIKKESIDKKNYDIDIQELFDNYYTLDDILDRNLNIEKLVNNFYGEYLISSFISSRVCRSIINKLTNCIRFENEDRLILIYYEDFKDVKIKYIDSILNFLDNFTKKRNKYKLIIYLSDEPKNLNSKLNYIGPDNVNSGYSISNRCVCIWRKEELNKVLFHEMVHYLNLHLIDYQYLFNDYFTKFNLESKFLNANEAYTEILALFLLSVWKFYYFKFYETTKLEDFVSKYLNIELAWSYYQMAKILNFFGCFKKYDDFINPNINCNLKETSNVVAYFFIKSFFLKDIKNILSFMDEKHIYITLKDVKYIKKIVNLDEDRVKKTVDHLLKNSNFDDDKSIRMTYMK